MAIIKLKADSREAAEKIKKLAKDLRELEAITKKPLVVKTDTRNANKTGHNGKGGVSAGNVAGSAALGGIIGGLGGAVIGGAVDLLGNAVTTCSKSILRLTTGFSDLDAKMAKYKTGLDTYENAGREALNRANKLDALDDERRGHKTATLEEELVWKNVWADEVGAQGTQLLDKVQSYFDKLINTEGKPDEIKKTLAEINKLGFSPDDLQQMNSWEMALKLLENYAAAGQDGVNELEKTLQTIVGTRQMGTVRKAVEVLPRIRQGVAAELPIAQEKMKNKEKALIVAADAERTKRLATYESFNTPDAALPKAQEFAIQQLKTEELKTAAMEGNIKNMANTVFDNIAEDLGLSKEHSETIKKNIKEAAEATNTFLNPTDKQQEKLNNTLSSAAVNLGVNTNPVGMVTNVVTKAVTGKTIGGHFISELKEFFNNHIGDAPKQLPTENKGSLPQQIEVKTTKDTELNSGLKELSNTIRNNSNYTRALTTEISNLKFSSNQPTNTTSTTATATFA